MNDDQTVRRVENMIACTVGLIEELTGEFSPDQRDEVGSTIFGFWATQEDIRHPREDGQLWKNIVKQRMAE